MIINLKNMVNKIFSSKLNIPLKILSKKALLEEIEKNININAILIKKYSKKTNL